MTSIDLRCDVCHEPANHIWRCEEHYCCDDCGSREHLCYYGAEDGLLCQDCFKKRVEKQVATFKDDTRYTDLITCPHCGYRINDSWERAGDDGDTLECSRCERSYVLTVHHEITYTTRKVKDGNK